MIKVIPPRAYPDLDGLPQVEPVKVAHAGLRGHDFAALVKRAGHPLAQWVRDHPPLPGEDYVHSHIFGVSERVGANRNHDLYGIKMSMTDLPTYEQVGRAYRNHRNSDPDEAMGVVKRAYLNEAMGRAECIVALNRTEEAAARNKGVTADRTLEKLASGIDVAVSQSCFPPGELVLMADGTQKPIEQVGHGDFVVTHLGNKKAVGHSVVIPYAGTVIAFRSAGVPGPVRATADHKVWVRPAYVKTAACPVCRKSFKALGAHLREQKDAAHGAVKAHYGRASEGWYRADEIRPGDYVRTPFDATVTAVGDPEYALVLGYYAAEGSVFEYHRGKPDADWRQGVDFTFGHTEKRYADRVTACIAKFGAVTVTSGVPKSRKTCYHVRASGCELRRRIEADAGRYSYAKRFSGAVMHWAPETQLVLLGAYFDGDGSWHKTNETLVANTVSEEMAVQLVTMCWRNGISATFSRFHSPAQQRLGKRPFYTVQVSGRYARRIPTDKVPPTFAFAESTPKDVSHLRHQAPGRKTTRKSATPFSYVDGAFVYRRVMTVTAEAYTGPVHNFSVEDDESYVVRLVGVKNCKIPYDTCTGCSNKARTRAEYCDGSTCKYGGCRDNLGRVFEDGHHLARDNPKCTFFDWSDVSDTRGADRTAFVTGKVAAGARACGGAELAELLNLVPPEHLLDPGALGALRCLRKLAAHQGAAPARPVADWDSAVAVRAKLAGVPRDRVPVPPYVTGGDAARHAYLADLAAGGAVLPPDVWLSTATGAPRDKCAAAFEGGCDPDRHLLARRDAAELLAEYRIGAPGPAHWLAPSARARGLEVQYALLGACTKRAAAGTVAPGARDEIKARYLAYQGAVLAAHETAPNFGLLLSECAGHNR